MQRLLEMNTVVEKRERFRRPLPPPTESSNKVRADLRRAACHGVYSRRQGRPAAEVQTRGMSRMQVPQTVRDEKRIPTITSYPIMGDNTVQVVRYTEPKQSEDKGLVWINQRQYFKGVPPEVWNFYVGGCQICQKWLRDREGRSLSHKDIRQYQRIVMALKEMLELMAGIDAVLQHRQFNNGLSNATHN